MSTNTALKYVFGPVYSSRLGHSLGLDLLGDTICSMDCLYCEAGKTTDLTCERKPYVAADELLQELRCWKENNENPDVVTLGGMGEPCLNTDMGTIIDGVREIMPGVPVAVLTNSSMLLSADVFADLLRADIVLPSLDSLVQKEFQTINRPAEGITVDAVAAALVKFRAQFSGKLCLEILLVENVNDSEDNLARQKAFVAQLQPDRVDVTTLSRPGAYAVRAVGKDVLQRWRDVLGSEGTLQNSRKSTKNNNTELTETGIMEIVRNSVSRRPQTEEQLVTALGIPQVRIRHALDGMIEAGEIESQEGFYAPTGFFSR